MKSAESNTSQVNKLVKLYRHQQVMQFLSANEGSLLQFSLKVILKDARGSAVHYNKYDVNNFLSFLAKAICNSNIETKRDREREKERERKSLSCPTYG